jgi:hypothetical protein
MRRYRRFRKSQALSSSVLTGMTASSSTVSLQYTELSFARPTAQTFTDGYNSPAPDCETRHPCQPNAMNDFKDVRLLPEEKLDALRHLDEFRFWYSLDDQRRCHRCHRVLTGRQILVLKPTGRRGQMRLQCPTEGCVSNSSEWAYIDPVHAASQKTPSARLQGTPRRTQDASERGKKTRHKDTRSQGALRRFAALRAALLQRSKSALLSTIPPAPDPIGP